MRCIHASVTNRDHLIPSLVVEREHRLPDRRVIAVLQEKPTCVVVHRHHRPNLFNPIHRVDRLNIAELALVDGKSQQPWSSLDTILIDPCALGYFTSDLLRRCRRVRVQIDIDLVLGLVVLDFYEVLEGFCCLHGGLVDVGRLDVGESADRFEVCVAVVAHVCVVGDVLLDLDPEGCQF